MMHAVCSSLHDSGNRECCAPFILPHDPTFDAQAPNAALHDMDLGLGLRAR